MTSKLLVVDDEASASFMVRQIFRKEIRAGEYELLFAENGRQALECVENDRDIRVVVTDINMPVMDGLSLLEQIHQDHGHVHVIMVSAYSDMGRIRRSMNYGAYDYLTKPVDAHDLKQTVARLFQRIQKKDEAAS